jgi:type VI secretion system secreted protein Hcp
MLTSAASVALVAPAPASALDWFLKIDGIKGESLDDKHKGEIEIESFSWGLRTAAPTDGSRSMKGRACVSEISLTKRADVASPLLLANAASGMNIPKAILIGRRSGGDPQDFFKVELSNILVSSVVQTGSTELVQEAFDLRFAKAQVVYTPQGADGKPGSPVEASVQVPTCN